MDDTAQFKGNFMRDSSSKWNLRNDVEFLKHLEKFSESVIRNASFIEKCMDDLEENLTLTYLKVKNISGQFQSVCDTQFVENRAHDDDDTEEVTKQNPQIDTFDYCAEHPQTVNNAKLEESISTCIRLLEDKFESIQLPESDSDDESLENCQVVLKPRKYYSDRPLPYIIGGQKFLNDSTLGLSLLKQEQEENVETDEDANDLLIAVTGNETMSHQQVVEFNESLPFLKKSLKDSINSYNMLTNNDCLEDDHNNSEAEAIQEDLANKIFDLKFNNSFPLANEIGNTQPSQVRMETDEENKMDSSSDETKPYSMDRMKSVLEQLYSSKPDIFVKKKVKADKMDVDSDFEVDANYSEASNIDDTVTNFKSVKVENKLSSNEIKKEIRIISFQNSNSHSSASEPLFDDLPNIPTKVLHSLSKNRPRNHQKRRPPSRKRLDTTVTVNTDKLSKDSLKQTNDKGEEKSFTVSAIIDTTPNPNLISPSTDEEDLFTVCSSNTPTDVPSDRLFQPLHFTKVASVTKNTFQSRAEEKDTGKQSTSGWDPFSEDDDLFFKGTSWSSRKFVKSSEKLSNDFNSSPSDDNIFKNIENSSNTSLFDDKMMDSKPRKREETNLSFFDDTDDEILFGASSDGRSDLFSADKSTDSNVPSLQNISSETRFKKDFLSDPLGFDQDCDTDQ